MRKKDNNCLKLKLKGSVNNKNQQQNKVNREHQKINLSKLFNQKLDRRGSKQNPKDKKYKKKERKIKD